jgi:hypothetical protein
MKKKVFILIVLVLLMTGCTAEYNLVIEDDTYKENITIVGETSNEINSFSGPYYYPTDKEEYENMPDYIDEKTFDKVYKYQLTGNKLTFTNDFTSDEFVNSLGASKCYNTVNVFNQSGNTIISTSQKNSCFTTYPMLNQIKVTITIDKPVVSSNATSVNGSTYTWLFNRDGKEDKSINLVFENATSLPPSSNSQKVVDSTEEFLDKYGLYIFLGVLIILILFGYAAFNKMKEKNNKMDD